MHLWSLHHCSRSRLAPAIHCSIISLSLIIMTYRISTDFFLFVSSFCLCGRGSCERAPFMSIARVGRHSWFNIQEEIMNIIIGYVSHDDPIVRNNWRFNYINKRFSFIASKLIHRFRMCVCVLFSESIFESMLNTRNGFDGNALHHKNLFSCRDMAVREKGAIFIRLVCSFGGMNSRWHKTIDNIKIMARIKKACRTLAAYTMA